MKKFWELFEQSIIVQAFVTGVLILTLCILFVMGRAIPQELLMLTTTVLGFWFGSKVGYRQATLKTEAIISRRSGDGND